MLKCMRACVKYASLKKPFAIWEGFSMDGSQEHLQLRSHVQKEVPFPWDIRPITGHIESSWEAEKKNVGNMKQFQIRSGGLIKVSEYEKTFGRSLKCRNAHCFGTWFLNLSELSFKNHGCHKLFPSCFT